MSLVGYYGDRDFGLRELHKATDDYRHTARFKITDLVVCIYNLYVEQMVSFSVADKRTYLYTFYISSAQEKVTLTGRKN